MVPRRISTLSRSSIVIGDLTGAGVMDFTLRILAHALVTIQDSRSFILTPTLLRTFVSLGSEVRSMRTFFQDVRFGIRTLLRKPGFTAAAVVALALGIGANTAIFSVVNGILLRPLPYPQQDRIMMIFEENPQQNRTRGPFSQPDFSDLMAQSRTFEKVAAYSNIGFTLID